MGMLTILLLLSCGLSILSVGFLSLYLRKRHDANKLQKELMEKDLALHELDDEIQDLQNKNTEFQTQLNQSLKDPVTQLLSWSIFEDRLKQAIHESARYQLTLAILYIDLDDFKVINDALGHETGDLLLQEVGKRLEVCVRQVDSITRLNKDVFVALLTQLGKPETAAIVAQRMLQMIKEPFLIQDQELFISCCIGIAIYPADGQDAATILRNADEALLLAKQKGKNVYQFYHESLHEESQRELAMHTSLSRETIFNEIVLYFQPIYNVTDQTILCLETLLHWQHPKLGLIKPEELFAYTEKQRKSNLISEWLLKNACKQFIRWQQQGNMPKYLAVTLSFRQLENIHFIYRISQILQEAGFNPSNLILEIKESTAQLPQDVLDKAFNMLRYLGIKIAIENFSHEPFALARLQKIGAAYLKIPPTIINELQQEKTMKFLKALNLFAQELSISLVAEGVNTALEVEALKDLGFVFMQGKYFQEPLPATELSKKLLTNLPSQIHD